MRRLLLTLALALFAGQAQAATRTALTGTWQKIASAGQSVLVENLSPAGAVVIATAAGGPPSNLNGHVLQFFGESRSISLTADLYAFAPGGPANAAVVVETGVAISAVGTTQATSPAVGAPSEASAALASLGGLNLLDTVAASSRLGWWFVQNQSGVPLTVALDDGTGNALSVFVMAPGGAGAQGASMGSADTGPHTGRIRVYGPAGSQHTLRTQ